MYNYLRLFNLKGLKECFLLDLGQINIICGKNNSGKSTLLEAISKVENKSFGKQLLDKDIDGIFKNSFNVQGWGDGDRSKKVQYRNTILGVISTQNIWYHNQANEFENKLTAGIKKDEELRRYSLNQASYKNAFSELFKDNHACVLIPPKRQLEIEKAILGSDVITPSGGGILNRLFRAKNQPDESDEKKILNQVQKEFQNISGGYTFEIFMKGENTASLSFAYKDRSWVSADACGLGLQDLLVLLWFSIDPTFNVLLIEEPESHIHPDMQRRLLSFFREQKDKQYFITTHSNIFVNNAYVDRVFFTQFKESVVVDDATSRASILNDIGYDVTDNLVSDLVIFVEGPKDVPFIEEFLIKYDLVNKNNIKIWSLGGDIMAQLDLSVFAQNYKLIALIDQDPASAHIRKKFMENCEALNIPVHQTERYAVENYFPLNILREVFVNQIDESVNVLDPKIKLEEQIKINVKNNSRKISQRMQLEDIQGTDMEAFFGKIAQLTET